MQSLVTVQNLSSRPKSIVHQGKQISLAAHASASFDKSIADRFLNTHVGTVVGAEDASAPMEAVLPGMSTTWIANVTGDPDAPEKVKCPPYTAKGGIKIYPEADNPKREAITVTRKYDLGQRPFTEKDGSDSALNLEQIKISIPPFTRKQFPDEVAQWMLMRDGMADPGAKGRIMKSRAPSSFEPDMTWPLDEMRVYLKLCDASKDVGPSEDEISAKANGDSDAEISMAKSRLWPKLFMMLVDPKVRLPTRSEFNEFMKGDGAAMVAKKVK